MEGAPEGGIFHIVNDRVTRIEELIDYTSGFLRLTGIRGCGREAFAAEPRNAVEILFDHYVEPYLPYMRDTRRFDAARSRPLLERDGVRCPDFGYEIFARCMSFAVESGWRSPLQAVPGTLSERTEKGQGGES